jgi:uncharacterized membrane protein
LANIIPWSEVHKRLQLIFPEGTPRHAACTREVAAKTVFVLLYLGAAEKAGVWMRPDQVTRMTDLQAATIDEPSRLAWRTESTRSSKRETPGRWYAVNTRESIRDDTLRNGLVENGAVVERKGLPTTSSLGRYALQDALAALFDPALTGNALSKAITMWQDANLSANARMAVAIMRKGGATSTDRVLVKFPNGETRLMAPGPSSELSKQVIEVFAPLFLKQPAVVFLSESREKVVQRDDNLAKQIGLKILADKHLPDIILADLGLSKPGLVFIEVVASDGPVSEARKQALLELASKGGFPSDHIRFVTAYLARSSAPFKKTVDSLAWGSWAWFASEPSHLLDFRDDASEGL